MNELVSFKLDRLDRLESTSYQKQLYRMRAEGPINEFHIPTGTMGGLVENPNNIHNSWVEMSAMVVDQAVVNDCWIRKESYIRDTAKVFGNSKNYLGGNMGMLPLEVIPV